MTEPDRWCLVVPVKRLALAKTRLAAVAGPHRIDLALAFALDTVEAALGCDLVLTVVAVTDEPDAANLVPSLVRRGIRFVPAIADAPIGPPRVCARPQSVDGRPLVGAIPGVTGLWVAAGHGPWGISTGPASGRMIADLIDGRLEAPTAALDPVRFGSPLR